MTKQFNLLLLMIVLTFTAAHAPNTANSGPEVVPFKAYPFALNQVRLLPGPFLHATELDERTLLAYEPDRLLAKFRSEAGLKPRAEHYRGWEDDTISGHSLGHYLSACAQMYQSTGDKRFLERVSYIVAELAECQEAGGDGYVAAIPNGKKILGEQVGKGDIKAQPFYLNGLWAPFYNIHKMLAGLRDAYRLCGNMRALRVASGMADWISRMTGGMSPEQIQTMLSCEHGGMNEVLADLYADTKSERYLQLSRVFHHKAVLDPMTRGEDILSGIHANTQIPKFIGLARRYELTGNEQDRKAALFFWDRVVRHHSYVTGGNGNHEYFGPPDKLRNRLSDETTESCNVYNMLKLTQHLFQQEAKAETADFYERALYNHILSSLHPETGRVIYNLSLEMGGRKEYQRPFDFTCCVGSGMENHSKHGGAIYYHNQEKLFVTLFMASELDWADKGVYISQDTRYPDEQGTTLSFTCKKPVVLDIKLRYPAWMGNDKPEILINGKPVKITAQAGSFISIRRKWQSGDKLSLKMPFRLRLEAMPDDPNRVAVCYGPLVLAGDLGPEDVPNPYARDFVPILRTPERDPAKWLTPVAGSPNTFQSQGVGYPRDITLKPFFQTHNRRYSVYWDIMTEAQWREQEAAWQREQERKTRLAAAATDFLPFCDDAAEKAHELTGDLHYPSQHQGRPYRQAERGGWFAWKMKVDPQQPMALVADYWGGFTGSKTFDILIDGQLIATENVSQKADGQFILVSYPIPPALTKGKQQVEVKLSPHTGHRAGPIFGIWSAPAELVKNLGI